jgi:protein phosphatase 1 regulatory subunit 37
MSATSSCSPSSSAVTIPIPGKSILKRPPAVQPSLFSRITRFLPAPVHSAPNDEVQPLKRAHFILPQIATVYPISSVNPPSTPTLKEEKKAIEDKEAERRRRVVRGSGSTGSGTSEAEEWWSLDKVESFYRECCAGAEEEPDPAITFAFKVFTHSLIPSPLLTLRLECNRQQPSISGYVWSTAHCFIGIHIIGRLYYRMGSAKACVSRMCPR